LWKLRLTIILLDMATIDTETIGDLLTEDFPSTVGRRRTREIQRAIARTKPENITDITTMMAIYDPAVTLLSASRIFLPPDKLKECPRLYPGDNEQLIMQRVQTAFNSALDLAREGKESTREQKAVALEGYNEVAAELRGKGYEDAAAAVDRKAADLRSFYRLSQNGPKPGPQPH
jgi:hypothetical protein